MQARTECYARPAEQSPGPSSARAAIQHPARSLTRPVVVRTSGYTARSCVAGAL